MSVYFDRAQKLEKLRSDPKLLAGTIKYYETNPADFINDWGMTLDPRVVPSNIPFVLFPRQVDLINFLYDKYMGKKDGVIEKTRDCGATWVCSAFSVWLWIFHKDQSVGWGSRKESLVDKIGDADSIFEKMRLFIRQLPEEFIPTGYIEAKHATHMKFINPENNSTITGEAGDNIGRGGRNSIYFKDESAFYERPEKIEAALSQNSNVKIDISTPNGNGNPFYRKVHDGKIEVFTFNWRDDPRKDDEWYKEQKRKLDPVIVAQEIDIDYDASVDNAFINPTDVDRAMHQDPSQCDDINSPVIIGVDPARYGSDRTAIVCRQGRLQHFYETYSQKSNVEVAGIVVQHIVNLPRPVSMVFVDEGGLGSGVVDILKERYPDRVKGVQFGGASMRPNASNKRTEMWLSMREWFEGKVSVENSSELRADLCSLQYKINSSGQYVLESKDEAKKRGVKSPDCSDALSLTFAEPVIISDNNGYEEHDNSRSTVTGY